MKLLPRNEKFFDLLLEQARMAREAAALIAAGLEGTPHPDFRVMAERVRDVDRRGCEAARHLSHQLVRTFITPIDPEDLHLLTTQLLDVLNNLEAAAYRCDAYGLTSEPEGMSEVAQLVLRCVEAVVDAVGVLDREGFRNADELTRRCEEIRRREEAAEDRVRLAVRQLFAAERDAIGLIKCKEILELMESVANECARLAETLEAVGVKNS